MNASAIDLNSIAANSLVTLQNQLQDFLTQVRTETGVPGISLVLSLGGQHVHAAVGHIASDSTISLSADARFQLGCITKLLTCIIASTLIDEGALDKDACISQYLPEFRDTPNGKNIAVWHLMSHTSGYQGLNLSDPAVAYYYSWSKFQHHFASAKQLFNPGSVFSYEHTEHVLVGEIIQRISGLPIDQLLRERIFAPLGLHPGTIRGDQAQPDINVIDHVYDIESKSFTRLKPIPFCEFWKASLSNLTMSLPELVRLAEAIVGFNQPEMPIANTPTRTAMEFVQKQVIKLPNTLGGRNPEQLPGAFGVGCAAYRGWLLGHNGSARGQTCGLRFDPRGKIALAIGINSWQPFLRDKIINHIFGVLRGHPIAPALIEPLEFSLEQLTGAYVGPQGIEANVVIRDERLQCNFTNASSKQHFEIMLTQDSPGQLSVQSDAQHHSVGFFKDPDLEKPSLMWGLTAFSKQ